MAILKLEPNKPRQIALRFREPKEVNGRKGREFQYSLQGGYTLYLPPIAADEIRSLNLDPGESFTILQSVGEGDAVKYEVERVPQPKPMGQARSIDSAARPDLTTPQSQHLFKQLVATIEAVRPPKLSLFRLTGPSRSPKPISEPWRSAVLSSTTKGPPHEVPAFSFAP